MHIENVTLPDSRTGVFKMKPVSPEVGIVQLRRWGLAGARAGSWARLNLQNGTELVYMDLVPRDVVFDDSLGDDAVYTPSKLRAVVIGGLRTHAGFQGKGYASFFLKKVIEVLKRGKWDIICNFVLDERLTFFLERGWEAVEDVPVKIRQPGNVIVDLPEQFTFVVYKLQDHVTMPEEKVDYQGLPA